MGSETDIDCGEVVVGNVKAKVSLKTLKKHVCPFKGCHCSFNRPWKLKRHICIHTQERPFMCEFPGCNKTYTNKSHLDRHKAIVHAESKPLPVYIPCPFPECKKVFMNKWSVKKHCNTHKTKPSYSCDICGINLNTYRQLQHHLSNHTGVFAFVCEKCKETFRTKRELKSHERKHKVYPCDYEGCFEEFKTWNALRSHTKTSHTSLYECDNCGKTYANKWTLTEHVLSHLPVDTRDVLTCPYTDCGRYYFHQRNLTAHIRSYHQDINHKCDFENCQRSFIKKAHLERHKRLHLEPNMSKSLIPGKPKQPRKPRKDKGIPRKSMAAVLSGIILPENVAKSLVQSNTNPEFLDCIEKTKQEVVPKENEKNSEIEGKD